MQGVGRGSSVCQFLEAGRPPGGSLLAGRMETSTDLKGRTVSGSSLKKEMNEEKGKE